MYSIIYFSPLYRVFMTIWNYDSQRNIILFSCRYLDLNWSCHFTYLCLAFFWFPFLMRSFCINPPDGWAGGVRTASWTDRLDASPPPSWRHNLFMSVPISKKHSDSVQSEKKKNMFFNVIIILFVMLIIMYNVKFPLFYFTFFFL